MFGLEKEDCGINGDNKAKIPSYLYIQNDDKGMHMFCSLENIINK